MFRQKSRSGTNGDLESRPSQARDAALTVKIIIILRVREMKEARVRACTRASHTHLAPLARGRKAICRMTNERRATWVASAVAGNGEQRAVSPRALSRSSCLVPPGPSRRRNERDRRTTRVLRAVPCRFSPRSAEGGPSSRDFLSARCGAADRAANSSSFPTSAASTRWIGTSIVTRREPDYRADTFRWPAQ